MKYNNNCGNGFTPFQWYSIPGFISGSYFEEERGLLGASKFGNNDDKQIVF